MLEFHFVKYNNNKSQNKQACKWFCYFSHISHWKNFLKSKKRGSAHESICHHAVFTDDYILDTPGCSFLLFWPFDHKKPGNARRQNCPHHRGSFLQLLRVRLCTAPPRPLTCLLAEPRGLLLSPPATLAQRL